MRILPFPWTYAGGDIGESVLRSDGRRITPDYIIGRLPQEGKDKVDLSDYSSRRRPTTCSACGDVGVWNAMKRVSVHTPLEVAPYELIMYTGSGRGSKLPDYVEDSGFTSLYGRSIPIAPGGHRGSDSLKAVVAGDGDTHREVGDHLLDTLRRSADIAIIVWINRVCGLAKGQDSPTSPRAFVAKTSPKPTGVIDEPVNPIALTLAAEATFVARSWSGDMNHLIEMTLEAIFDEGAARLDVIQPCLTFNPGYACEFCGERHHKLGEAEAHDATGPCQAWVKSQEWGSAYPSASHMCATTSPRTRSVFRRWNAGRS